MSALTDGDLSSCAPRNGGTRSLFGLFLDKIPRTRILLSVIGRIQCKPVDGLQVTIVSVTHQSNVCETMLSQFSNRCHYRCFCKTHDICSHVFVGIIGVDDEICEILVG